VKELIHVAQDLNDDGQSALAIDLYTEDLLARIAQRVHDVEQMILVLDNRIDQNKIDRKPNKENKPLKKQKNRFTRKKNALEKE
jgi:hypothetical protein